MCVLWFLAVKYPIYSGWHHILSRNWTEWSVSINNVRAIVENLHILLWNRRIPRGAQPLRIFQGPMQNIYIVDFPQCPILTNAKLLTSFINVTFVFISTNKGLTINVMRSSGISHMSGTIKFEIFYDSIGRAIKDLSFAANPIKIGLVVPKTWTILSGWKQ